MGRGPRPRNPSGSQQLARYTPVSPRHTSRPTRASGGPLPRAAARGAARRPCPDRGKGWRWGREAGIGAGPGPRRPRSLEPAAAATSTAETRLEMGELTLASRGTRTAALPSRHSWPSASISALRAQHPPRQAVRAPTAPSLPGRHPMGWSGSPRTRGWGHRDKDVGAGFQGDYWALMPPPPTSWPQDLSQVLEGKASCLRSLP